MILLTFLYQLSSTFVHSLARSFSRFSIVRLARRAGSPCSRRLFPINKPVHPSRRRCILCSQSNKRRRRNACRGKENGRKRRFWQRISDSMFLSVVVGERDCARAVLSYRLHVNVRTGCKWHKNLYSLSYKFFHFASLALALIDRRNLPPDTSSRILILCSLCFGICGAR